MTSELRIAALLDRHCSGIALAADLHSHTARCKHAMGDVIDYALAAASCGLAAIATTDHGPYIDDRWSNFRMAWHEVEDYIQAIDAARAGTSISVISGFEYEYVPDVTEQALALLRRSMRIEVVLFGPHVFPRAGKFVNTYTEVKGQHDAADFLAYCAEAVGSDLFDIVAHPDLFTRFVEKIGRKGDSALNRFIETCFTKGVTCELNAAEFAINPRLPSYYRFWGAVADAQLPVVINSDAHAPSSVNVGRDSAAVFAHEMRLRLL